MGIQVGQGGIGVSPVRRPETISPSPAPTPSYVNSSDEMVIEGSDHYAFGGCTLTGTTVLVVVRRGTDHDVDGNLVKFTSTDYGLTWSSETTIRDNTKDIRDPDLVTLANGNVVCTFTERTNSAAATDFIPYAMVSTDGGATWGSPVVITSGFSGWGFISARVLELANGDLLAPLYGNDGTTDYCRVSKSTDGGATWTALSTVVAAGTSSRVWDEPYLTRDGSTIYCAIRSDTSTAGIYIATSADSGATWSAPVRQFDGSGRPSIFHTADDGLAILYRHTSPSSGRTAARFSFDDATTWSSPYLLNSTKWMTYGSWTDLLPHQIGCVWCVELNSVSAAALFDTFTFDPT